jgi:hypothetical protein
MKKDYARKLKWLVWLPSKDSRSILEIKDARQTRKTILHHRYLP